MQCTVTNTGQRAGEEVVQLYLHDLVASVARPVKELKDFKKISLKPGETQTITFTLTKTSWPFTTRSWSGPPSPASFS